MSFQDEIKKFNKNRLKHTETLVTTATGTTYLEDKNTSTTNFVPSGDDQFFVVDFKPDLQVGEILPYLCLGSADVSGDLDLLESMGVTHILNVSTMRMDNFPEKFIYKYVPMMDISKENLICKLRECFDFINYSKSCNGKVLVHCMAGISRSASVVIAYVMKLLNVTFDYALNEVKKHRPSINPNDGFRKQLMSWDLQLR